MAMCNTTAPSPLHRHVCFFWQSPVAVLPSCMPQHVPEGRCCSVTRMLGPERRRRGCCTGLTTIAIAKQGQFRFIVPRSTVPPESPFHASGTQPAVLRRDLSTRGSGASLSPTSCSHPRLLTGWRSLYRRPLQGPHACQQRPSSRPVQRMQDTHLFAALCSTFPQWNRAAPPGFHAYGVPVSDRMPTTCLQASLLRAPLAPGGH